MPAAFEVRLVRQSLQVDRTPMAPRKPRERGTTSCQPPPTARNRGDARRGRDVVLHGLGAEPAKDVNSVQGAFEADAHSVTKIPDDIRRLERRS